MDLLSKLEQAVGNEYLSNQIKLAKINQEKRKQPDSNIIVSLQSHSKKVVKFKPINA